MEIYNDRIFDLLGGSTPASTDFQVVEERGRGIVVRGLSSHEVEDEAQALRLLFEGEGVFVFVSVSVSVCVCVCQSVCLSTCAPLP